MSTGIKHRIVNQVEDIKFLDTAGAETSTPADVVRILIPGTATLERSKFKPDSFVKTAPTKGIKEVSTVTVSGTASSVGRNSVSMKIEMLSSRNEAEFSRYRRDNGKDLIFSGVVPADATAAQIVTEIKKNVDARAARFGDLPFTYSVSGGVITITANAPHLTVGDVTLTISDKEGDHSLASVAKAVTTDAVLPQGQGSQIEENIAFLTEHNATAGGFRADERVDLGAEYIEFFLEQTFDDAISPMPNAAYSTQSTAGEFGLALIVNSKLDTDPKVTLLDTLFDGVSAGAWNV